MPASKISSRTRQRDQRRETFERDGRLDLGDGVSLYRHRNSNYIYADFRIGGDRTRESTKTTDVAMAEQVAIRRRKALACRAEAGKPISVQGPSVGDVLEAYIADLVRRQGAGEHKLGPEISVMRRNFLPFWRTIPLADLDRRQFYAWESWRSDQNAQGAAVAAYQRGTSTVSIGRKLKPPRQSTLRREKQYFVKALTWACDQPVPLISDEVVHGLRHLPRPRESKKQRIAGEKRVALTAIQVAKLLDEFRRVEDIERARVQKLGERGKRKNYDRRLMALHVRLLLCTGLRPGAEILELTWDCLSQVKNEHGEDIVVIDRCGDGKTGPRMVNADPEAVEVLADLRALLKEFGFAATGQATLWPSRHGGVVRDMGASFKSTLKRLGFDATISGEPLYICRHTYLTERLRKGVTSDILAINCGTSNEMISRHYNHLKSEDIRGALRPADARNPLRLNVVGSPISGETKLTLDPTGQIVFTR